MVHKGQIATKLLASHHQNCVSFTSLFVPQTTIPAAGGGARELVQREALLVLGDITTPSSDERNAPRARAPASGLRLKHDNNPDNTRTDGVIAS